ncbi:uncharacterized protein LOC132038524 [Lycium ferocissimum]|uniref:uncharacterized protein LOC132038524 n=1 Tax=Lycium ferocissimum TaxID=112874 RepID=UPI002815DDAB|nr:uncharacterized protein LOC132038524 [Lycium ferocissimum]
MNLPHLHPIPHCSFNVSYSSLPPSSQSLRKNITSFTISATSRPIVSRQIPARDRIIDFGKHKGKMLGTLPSKYLKWVTKNLRARDFEEWAQLADQVLSDPIYNDRIEWEFAQNLLNGDVSPGTKNNAVSELLEISTRFGWDNEDKLGWSKIDFELLGTSKGGRIPRLIMDSHNKKSTGPIAFDTKEESEKDNRERRRERVRLQRRKSDPNVTDRRGNVDNYNVKKEQFVTESGNRFPGREALLKKALSLGSRKSF